MIDKLKIKIFADGADIKNIEELCKNPLIKGFTTNPSLMKKKGISDYKKFAIDVLKVADNKPVSFEIFADDLNEMEEQANEIASWGKNINVKIPITNTKGESTNELIKKLSNKKIICNVTAILTIDQLKNVLDILNPETPAILSIFAGRIADTGIDPLKTVSEAVKISKSKPLVSILWASTRQVYSIFDAESTGCHIITVPHDIIHKFEGLGKDLDQLSLETVRMFYEDAKQAGYKIEINDK
jgi:transaldolase|tara:strand:- start:995 stop:1720 length:726 start_codon:yes stop_codon:yes gene_type:complete